MEAKRLKQMLSAAMSAHSKSGQGNNPLRNVALMRIRLGVFQLTINDGFRLCRTQETDIDQGDESPFGVEMEAMHQIVQAHSEGYVTVMPHEDCVEFTYDDGVEYKFPRWDTQIATNITDYIADMEPHINTRWAEIDVKQLRKLFIGWKQDEACYMHMNGLLQIKRSGEVVHEQPCDFGGEVFAEVNPRYVAAALKSLGKTGYLGLHENRICIADSKNELPAYMHIIMTMRGNKK